MQGLFDPAPLLLAVLGARRLHLRSFQLQPDGGAGLPAWWLGYPEQGAPGHCGGVVSPRCLSGLPGLPGGLGFPAADSRGGRRSNGLPRAEPRRRGCGSRVLRRGSRGPPKSGGWGFGNSRVVTAIGGDRPIFSFRSGRVSWPRRHPGRTVALSDLRPFVVLLWNLESGIWPPSFHAARLGSVRFHAVPSASVHSILSSGGPPHRSLSSYLPSWCPAGRCRDPPQSHYSTIALLHCAHSANQTKPN